MNVLYYCIYNDVNVFYSVFTIWGGRNAHIFDTSFLSDRKGNLVGVFGRSKLKISINYFYKNANMTQNLRSESFFVCDGLSLNNTSITMTCTTTTVQKTGIQFFLIL